jgi:hypothetical protein
MRLYYSGKRFVILYSSDKDLSEQIEALADREKIPAWELKEQAGLGYSTED